MPDDVIGPYTQERRLCDDDGIVSDALTGNGPADTYLSQHNRLGAMTDRPPVVEPFPCTGSAHLAGEHIRCTSPAHTATEDECSPTPPLSSTASDVGPPPTQEQPEGSPTASAETREVTYSAQIPHVDPPIDVECTMRLTRRSSPGRPELWTVSVPPSVSTSSRAAPSLPPSVHVKGRAAAEGLCRALAINYAIHTGECLRSDERYRAHVTHFLAEAGAE